MKYSLQPSEDDIGCPPFQNTDILHLFIVKLLSVEMTDHEVMDSKAFYNMDKLISTIHQRVYNDHGVWFVFNTDLRIMCNNILYPESKDFLE